MLDLAIKQIGHILSLADQGEMTFDDAVKMIGEIKVSKFKKDSETLNVDISLMFFAGSGKDSKFTLSSIGGTECKITAEKLSEFTKSTLLWKLKLKDIELNQIKEMILAYEGALERYGHFDDKE